MDLSIFGAGNKHNHPCTELYILELSPHFPASFSPPLLFIKRTV